jgi:hypothetical protein
MLVSGLASYCVFTRSRAFLAESGPCCLELGIIYSRTTSTVSLLEAEPSWRSLALLSKAWNPQ